MYRIYLKVIVQPPYAGATLSGRRGSLNPCRYQDNAGRKRHDGGRSRRCWPARQKRANRLGIGYRG